MNVLFVLIPISISMAALFVGLCLYAIRKGQFKDFESPRWRVLFDSDPMDKSISPQSLKDAHAKN